MLTSLKLSKIAQLCEGELSGNDAVIEYVKTDSREVLAESLFLALKGESFDGHNYLVAARKSGAVAVLGEVSTDVIPSIKVSDSLEAYGRIARHQRDCFLGKVIAITGSNGKTTVKDWLAQCLAAHFSVLKTAKNNNNQVGVPLTLLGLQNEHDVAIIEAGTSYSGEIARLANIIGPDIAIITNASGSHLSGLGSLEGVAKEKGALLSGLPDNGVAILNNDDTWFPYWRSLTENKVLSFGFTDSADMYATDILLNKSGSTCIIHFNDAQHELTLHTPGKHQIANAMAVLLGLLKCGLSLQDGLLALQAPLSIAGRLEFLRSNSQSLILNDCYNASPTSVEAAIDVLSYQEEGTKWLVLGALGELGDTEYDTHKSLGEYAMRAGVNRLITIGPIAAIAAQSFSFQGGDSTECEDHAEALSILQSLGADNAILIKGSRSSKMEKIVEKLVN